MDSNHASDLDDCRSLTAYVFMLACGVVSLKASLYDHVALSLTEAKYVALTFIAKEAVWLKVCS